MSAFDDKTTYIAQIIFQSEKVSQERMWKCVHRLKMTWLDDINTLRLINILRASLSVILSSKSSHDHHRYDQPI